jgi:hypothetical protein
MGYKLMRRVLTPEMAARIPKDHIRLVMILADHAHDGDDRPCCWVSPAELTFELEGSNGELAGRRFRRSVDALIKAKVIARAEGAHEGRPKSRKCPTDGRRFHVELLLTDEIVAPGSPPSETEIVDAARPLNPEVEAEIADENSGRQTVEIVDVRRPLHRGTNEDPSIGVGADLEIADDEETDEQVDNITSAMWWSYQLVEHRLHFDPGSLSSEDRQAIVRRMLQVPYADRPEVVAHSGGSPPRRLPYNPVGFVLARIDRGVDATGAPSRNGFHRPIGRSITNEH